MVWTISFWVFGKWNTKTGDYRNIDEMNKVIEMCVLNQIDFKVEWSN